MINHIIFNLKLLYNSFFQLETYNILHIPSGILVYKDYKKFKIIKKEMEAEFKNSNGTEKYMYYVDLFTEPIMNAYGRPLQSIANLSFSNKPYVINKITPIKVSLPEFEIVRFINNKLYFYKKF